jgi:hypothetical protein
MTFAMRPSVMTARGRQECLSAELTFIDAKCEADHPRQNVPSRGRLADHCASCVRNGALRSFSASGYAQIRGRARGELFG